MKSSESMEWVSRILGLFGSSICQVSEPMFSDQDFHLTVQVANVFMMLNTCCQFNMCQVMLKFKSTKLMCRCSNISKTSNQNNHIESKVGMQLLDNYSRNISAINSKLGCSKWSIPWKTKPHQVPELPLNSISKTNWQLQYYNPVFQSSNITQVTNQYTPNQ